MRVPGAPLFWKERTVAYQAIGTSGSVVHVMYRSVL